jgi:hypothetical protein
VKVVKRKKEWWITGIEDCADCGPYDTKADAEDDMRGLKRFDKYCHLKSYWTCEK